MDRHLNRSRVSVHIFDPYQICFFSFFYSFSRVGVACQMSILLEHFPVAGNGRSQTRQRCLRNWPKKRGALLLQVSFLSFFFDLRCAGLKGVYNTWCAIGPLEEVAV